MVLPQPGQQFWQPPLAAHQVGQFAGVGRFAAPAQALVFQAEHQAEGAQFFFVEVGIYEGK